jgi:cardiolipin synthase
LGFIPHWLAILVISRDVIILLGFIVLFIITGHSIIIRPTFVGKASTFFQLLTVTQTLVKLHNPGWYSPALWYVTLGVAGGATVISGMQYLVRAVRWLTMQEKELSALLAEPRRDEEGTKQQRSSA